MPREILVDWITASGGGKRSVLYFDSALSVVAQRDALGDMLAGIDANLDNGVSWQIETEGRDLDDTTGQLTGVWSDTPPFGATGAAAGECVADATQALIQWNTGVIINGRFVTGHTYIPGLSTSFLVNGNLSGAVIAGWAPFLAALIAANVGFSVWHRPVAQAGGFSAVVLDATVRSELAVLRRRRG